MEAPSANREDSLPRTWPLRHPELRLQPPECKKINSCCFSCPVYGILLGQPRQMNTSVNWDFSDFFFSYYIHVLGLGEPDHRRKMPFSQHPIKSAYYHPDLTGCTDCHHLDEAVFVREILHTKIIIF